MVPDAAARKELLEQVQAILGAGGFPIAEKRDRLNRVSQVLAIPIAKLVAPAASGQTAADNVVIRPAAVSR